jgi:hypothetical protein
MDFAAILNNWIGGFLAIVTPLVLAFLLARFTKLGRIWWARLGQVHVTAQWMIGVALVVLVTEGGLFLWLRSPLTITERNSNVIGEFAGGQVLTIQCNGDETALAGGCILWSPKKSYLTYSGTTYRKKDATSGYECVYSGEKLVTGDAITYVGCANKSRIQWWREGD